jgi:hypothetical protein
MSADPAVSSIIDALVAERGGKNNFGVVDLAIAHQVAVLLSGGTPSSSSVGPLLELLPPKSTSKPLDLSLLTDSELETLIRLTAIACGEAPPSPKRRKRPLWFKDAANLCIAWAKMSKVDAFTGKPLADHDPNWLLSRADQLELRNLFLLCLPGFCGPLYQALGLGPEPECERRPDLPPELLRPCEPDPPVPVPQPSNVVSIPRRPLHEHPSWPR